MSVEMLGLGVLEPDGIEDARFVRFVDDDGSVMYYATYTAYNGREILPQLTSSLMKLRTTCKTNWGSWVRSISCAARCPICSIS